jgi:hypothetical protein
MLYTGCHCCRLLPVGVYKNARNWLMSAKGLNEDQALTLLTVACDFNVHQVRLAQLSEMDSVHLPVSCRWTVSVCKPVADLPSRQGSR